MTLDIPEDFSRGMDLNPAIRRDITAKFSTDNDMGDMYIRLENGRLAHDQCPFRKNFTLKVTVYPNSATERQLSLE